MSNYITQCSLGYSVYGQEQFDYTVNGQTGKDYGVAVAMACFYRAAGVEDTLSGFRDVVNIRRKKIQDLSKCLADLSSIISAFGPKSKTTDKIKDARISEIYNTLYYYTGPNVYENFGIKDDGSITYGDSQIATSSIQYAIDIEDTELQEDMTYVQSLVDMRDSAYQLGGTLLNKVNNTEKTGIQAIG